ncbi:MAG: MATE family efflux transporter [Clostridiales bacterium]|nr:MATE family efflux transporter [Clostridiales bacterium]
MIFFWEDAYGEVAKIKKSLYNNIIMTKENEKEAAISVDNDEKAAILEKKQYQKMTQTPIARLIIGLGIPTTLSMMITSLYNLADTAFVSMIGNDAVTAAVGNLLALMSIIQAIGFTYGMGSGALVSRLLGKRDRAGADRVASSSFFIALVSGILIAALSFIFLTPLLKLFGSIEENVLQYSKEYAVYILISAPFMCMSFVLNNVLRAEGKAVLSMVGLVVGAVINVALDPLLIFTAGMGISGAGLATCISQIISFCVLLAMFLSGKTVVRLKVRSISRSFKVYKDVIVTGFPSFCRQVLASLCAVFLNHAAHTHGGESAQAAFSVVQKVFMLAFSLSLGIGQGYQPVLGYNYSAKRYDRVKKAYLFTLGFSTLLMIAFAGICAIIAPNLMQWFSLSPTATEIGTMALRLQCLSMALLPLNFMAGLSYQVVGSKTIASLLSITRQGLFYIPSILLLPRLWGILGVEACQTVSDALSFLFAIPFTILFFSNLKGEETSRGWSYTIVGIVYAFAVAVGWVTYYFLPFDFWLNLLIADVAATIVTFAFSVVFKNASVYDPYWSVQPIVILIAFIIGKPITATRLLPLIAVCLWGIRLTANWAYTFHGLHHQDWRYTQLKEQSGKWYPLVNFFGIHLVPTLVVYACTLPAVYVMQYGGEFNAGAIVFFILSLLAVALQGTADVQMHKFRKNRTGNFIRKGLWKYSRHPNYLGEILMWWGVALAAVCVMPTRWWLLAGAVANTLLFVCISIPLAEKRQSRKEGYERYKQETRALLPIKKRIK